MERKKHTCCFFGHRKINLTDRMIKNLKEIIENLITKKQIDTFLFGSRSEFDKLCLKIVTKLKKKYSHIKRIYVRAEFLYIDESYKSYLLESYENTYYPKKIENSGKAVYVERNYEMIDNSSFCVICYDENYLPLNSKSGTRLAYNYAIKRNLKIINIMEEF